MRDFVADTGTDGITHVVDPDGALWRRFGIVSQPAFADVGRDGAVRTVPGGRDAEELTEAVEQLLAGG